MKILFLSAVMTALGLMTSSLALAKNLSNDEKLSDFNQLIQNMSSSYGPLLYKQETQGIDLTKVSQVYREKILASESNASFYYTLNQFISEFHDGHFGGSIPSDLRAEVPITTDLVDGKVLVDSIDRTKLDDKSFPFAKGDEIISLNGQPVNEVLNHLKTFLGGGFELSERRSAAQALFVRSGKRFPVPSGLVVVEVRRGTSDIIEKANLTWTVTGTAFDEKTQSQTNERSSSRFDDLGIQKETYELLGKERAERSYRCSGTTRIVIPADATVLIKDPFVAYYHPTAKGNIGYLRIPHYYWQDEKGNSTYEQVFQKYEWVIQQLEKNTVGLIIDQDHNCGGSVSFLHRMMSLFISQPFKPMQFQLLATKKEYFSFKTYVDEVTPNTVEAAEAQTLLTAIKTAWDKGDFLTEKLSIDGNELVYPNRYVYTKPIVMLIDELAGSGGDGFPSMMGGYQRAKLVGTRTWGLGGHVEDQNPLNYSGYTYRMTKSLFYRPDGVAVENNGAVPEVNYTITRDDFLYQYKDYQKFYLNELFKMLP